MSEVRLQVALARMGVASRRKAAELIKANRVRVNGRVINQKGFHVDIPKDKITLDNKPIVFEKKKYYYILNKPANVLSTARDERGRKKVLDYVIKKNARLYPVGRLDKDTTGLIILTNDGGLTYRLTHPKFGIDRIYRVTAKGRVKEEDVLRLREGIIIDGKLTKAEKVVFRKKTPNFTILVLTLREGIKREVRKMFEAVGHSVLGLKRVAYGPLKLGTLKEGEVRILTKGEVDRLKSCVGLV